MSAVNLVALGWIAVAVASFVFAAVSYLRMMRTISHAVARLHMARLRVRSNLLFLAAPQLFVGAGATWRRRYIVAALVFAASVAAAGLTSAFAPR